MPGFLFALTLDGLRAYVDDVGQSRPGVRPMVHLTLTNAQADMLAALLARARRNSNAIAASSDMPAWVQSKSLHDAAEYQEMERLLDDAPDTAD